MRGLGHRSCQRFIALALAADKIDAAIGVLWPNLGVVRLLSLAFRAGRIWRRGGWVTSSTLVTSSKLVTSSNLVTSTLGGLRRPNPELDPVAGASGWPDLAMGGRSPG